MKNKTVSILAQQGDVVLRKLDAMPDGEQKIISRKRCVLAEGEHIGHCHAVEESDAELIQIGERMLLRLDSAKHSGPLSDCTLLEENETSFLCDTPVGKTAFAKSSASFCDGVVEIGEFALLMHQEHYQQAISPGIWEIGRVQEYDYFTQMARPVQD